jgi:glycosyltransferase involved in cell wall biosynthesis
MRVLVGMPSKGQLGGVYITEEKFIAECARRGDPIVSVVQFGSRISGESILRGIVRLLRDLPGFARAIQHVNPGIIHLNSSFDRKALLRDTCYVLLSKILKRKVFIKFHGSDVSLVLSPFLFWKILTKVLLINVAAVGVLSSEEKNNFIGAGYPATKFIIVKNVVDAARFSNQKNKTSEDQRIKLLFISRLIPEKGLIDVIHATKLIVQSFKSVELLCVGDGPQRKEAEGLVRRLEMESCVSFTGFVEEEETVKHYLSSTILLFPTYHHEGFSMVLFQAVAAGLPIITTRIRAAADYLKEPDNCLWVEPRNPAMIAKNILYLLNNEPIMNTMKANNITLGKEFSASRVTQEFINTYRQFEDRSK